MFLETMSWEQLKNRIRDCSEFVYRNADRNFGEWEKLIRKQRPLPLYFYKSAKDKQKNEFLFVGHSKDGRTLYTAIFTVIQTAKGKSL